MKFLGSFLIFVGVALGLYVGVYLGLYGGIYGIVKMVQAHSVTAGRLTWDIIRILVLPDCGWLIFYLFFTFGAAVIRSSSND